MKGRHDAGTTMITPNIVAHRGYHSTHPENSLSAFRSAERLGCAWVECDVHASADGVPIVIHDDTLDRTTSGTGRVADRVCSDLSSMRLKFGDRLTGEPVPTLPRLLAALRPETGILVELKPHDSPGLVRNVLKMLRAERRPWVLQSFDPANLLEVRARDPGAPMALLVEDAAGLERAVGEAWPCVNADHVLLNADVVGSLRARGAGVGAWTVNAEPDLRRAVALGLDWLITDEPLLARELCNAAGV
jgi:glycerophosphoryl diester phosphodiesterase